MDLQLKDLKGIGPQMLHILRNNGIWKPYDLLLNIPKSYEDFSITSIEKWHHKETITCLGHITSELKLIRGYKKDRVHFQAKIYNHTIDIIVFGRNYLIKEFKKNDCVLIKGTYDLYKNSIVASTISRQDKQIEIKPHYRIEGIHDLKLTHIMKDLFESQTLPIYENLPKELLDERKLMSRREAFYQLHLPQTFEAIDEAKRRLKYEEAFFMHLNMKKDEKIETRAPKPYDIHQVRALIEKIPYTLTLDQKEAVNDIFRDFKKPFTFERLIQGDVGSGKTMVALLAAYAIVTAKEQVAVMAPTELLARQHYQYFKTYLKDVNIALLTRKTKDKDMMKHMIFSHQYDIVIGTHALIEEDVLFKQLGLVVIDEQHKFGVSTREKLIEKGKHKDVLYLTATPIPRTLAMLTYGYAKISLMKEKPKRREAILTKYITKQTIDDMYSMMHSALIRKEHIFLVVPAITSDKVTDNIETVYQEIIQEFPHAPIFMLHGKLSSDDQDRMMENFITTPGSILLSTTMIEVGIDIPTATLIGIYAAENFGLAQLHQLRGRVGRGNLASFCYLISTKEDVERLDMLVQSDDGFKLAEFDLIERGPGDFIGHLQSGYLDFKYLDILEDEEIFLTAKEDLEKIMNQPDFNSNPKYRYLYKTYTKQT
ncbi:MAG: hypothetical protein CVV61_00040 [Tenericutes bacterium HGW-Tenericutes-6]|nr:MAG: hypothetical protein CVV61_00040 [Tenericutes bacterium HGW-Tenericutes-6]